MSHPTIENSDAFRSNMCKKLEKYFDLEETFTKEKQEKNAINLEKGIYNWSLKEANNRNIVKKWNNPFFVKIYLDHFRSVYFNMNENLVAMVANEEIQVQEIAFMTHQEMLPEKWKDLIREKSVRDKNKFEQNLEAATDTFKCRKCKSKKCTYYQMQTRSADEPMTIFVTCIDCGNRWKTS